MSETPNEGAGGVSVEGPDEREQLWYVRGPGGQTVAWTKEGAEHYRSMGLEVSGPFIAAARLPEQPDEGPRERLRGELVRFLMDGDRWHPDDPKYRLVNLREALNVVPDTGDWHAEVRSLLDRLIASLPSSPEIWPNATADEQRERIAAARPTVPEEPADGA